MPEKQSEMPTIYDVKLASYLVHFFRHSYNIRTKSLAYNVEGVDPPVVTELINFILWHGGMNVIDEAEHTLALSNIVHESRQEVKHLADLARKSDSPELYLQQAKKFYDLALCADGLLSKLSLGKSDEEE